ncbi:MAG: helix-turn-helix transcriptional regulator [Pseudomonadota bacterium]
MSTPAGARTGFGDLLRSWRTERRLSQMALACAVETPPRHVSFLETGRSAPSRTMVGRLATALRVPLRDRNDLYRSAGFADVYPGHSLSDEEMGTLRLAVTQLMEAHAPFPAFVVDNHWTVLDANGAGRDTLALVADPFPLNDPDAPFNIIDAVFDPRGFRRFIVNWEDYARHFIQRLHREAVTDEVLRAILDRVEGHSGLPKDWWALDPGHTDIGVFPILMRVHGRVLSFFTVVTAVALPTNALAQDLRLETMLPADAATRAVYTEGSRDDLSCGPSAI